MALIFNVEEYIAMTSMSGKARILVEGRTDKSHISSLLETLYPGGRVRIDSANDIKGSCKKTASNNRAKIEKIHDFCKVRVTHRKLFFLCDREFRNFEFGAQVQDKLDVHETDGNMSWTLGHSIENYFICSSMLGDGFKFLTASGYKNEAALLFCDVFSSAVRLVAAATLAAKNLQCANYPVKAITAEALSVVDGEVSVKFENPASPFEGGFINSFNECLAVAYATDELVCSRFCRGHTAVILLQRVFASCLLSVGSKYDAVQAKDDANWFSNVSEIAISNALSESWVRKVSSGDAMYPMALIESVQGVAKT